MKKKEKVKPFLVQPQQIVKTICAGCGGSVEVGFLRVSEVKIAACGCRCQYALIELDGSPACVFMTPELKKAGK